MSGVVSEVGLWSNVCAVGFVMSSRVLVGLGGRANVFGDAGSYVELEALGLWLLLSGVLFCSRCRFALFSFTAFLTQLNSSSRVVSTTLYAQDFGVLSSVSINAGVEARVFADAGYIRSEGGGDSVCMLPCVRKYRCPSCSITAHRSSSVREKVWPLRPLS